MSTRKTRSRGKPDDSSVQPSRQTTGMLQSGNSQESKSKIVQDKLDGNDTLVSGRSTRKRIPSKRYQDMETDFGRKPSPQKAKKRKTDNEPTDEESAVDEPSQTKTSLNDLDASTRKGNKIFVKPSSQVIPAAKLLRTTVTSTGGNSPGTTEVVKEMSKTSKVNSAATGSLIKKPSSSAAVSKKLVDKNKSTTISQSVSVPVSSSVAKNVQVLEKQSKEQGAPVKDADASAVVSNVGEAASSSTGGEAENESSKEMENGEVNASDEGKSNAQAATTSGASLNKKTCSVGVTRHQPNILVQKKVAGKAFQESLLPGKIASPAASPNKPTIVLMDASGKTVQFIDGEGEKSDIVEPASDAEKKKDSVVDEVEVGSSSGVCEGNQSDSAGKDSDKTQSTDSSNGEPPAAGSSKDGLIDKSTNVEVIKVMGNSTCEPASNVQVIEITKEQAECGQILLLTSTKDGQANIVFMDSLTKTGNSSSSQGNTVKGSTKDILSVTVGIDKETQQKCTTYKCRLCDYSTDRKSNFYKHKVTHTVEKKYKCTYDNCTYEAKSRSNLKRHLLIHENARNYECPLCDLKFRQKIHVERHIKYIHQEKTVKCPHCKYTCANENPDLKLHIQRKHQPRPTAASEGINCQLCDFVAASKKDLRQHLKFHRRGPEVKLYCELCSFVTDCKSRLKRHVYTHTQEKPFSCSMCSYTATQKEHIMRHMRSKHKVDLPQGMRRPRRVDLESAELFVSNDHAKIFACNFCTMKFEKVLNLYKHLHQQHADAMPQSRADIFSCVVCDYATNRKNNLLVHMRKHNLPSPDDDDRGYPAGQVYSCVLCNYVNPKRRNLYMHMKKKHKISIMVRRDGSANCIVEENSAVTIVTKDKEEVEEVSNISDPAPHIQQVSAVVTDNDGDTRYVDITELTSSLTTRKDINAPPAVAAEVQVQHDAADAIEGLQALSEYKGAIVPTEVTTEPVATVTPVITSEESAARPGNFQLSQEQLTHLSSGDYVEINGEMYKVEFSENT